MSKCSVCGKPRRAGTGGRVNLLDAAGQLRSVVACAACLSRSIAIVAQPPPTTTLTESDDSDVRKVLRGLARHLRGIGQGYTRDILAPAGTIPDAHMQMLFKRDGIEQAADIAEAWARFVHWRKPTADAMSGWVCPTCRKFVSDAPERRETCPVCAGPRLVGSNVSHVFEPIPQCRAMWGVYRCTKPIHHPADGHENTQTIPRVGWTDETVGAYRIDMQHDRQREA